ncbi:hypothetical protein GCM10027347_56390 [Larkinella harenae]
MAQTIRLELKPLQVHSLLALLHEPLPRKDLLHGLAATLKENIRDQLDEKSLEECVEEATRNEIGRLAGLPSDQIFDDDELSILGLGTPIMQQRLAAALTNVIQVYHSEASVTLADVADCETVSDCIKMVKGKI